MWDWPLRLYGRITIQEALQEYDQTAQLGARSLSCHK